MLISLAYKEGDKYVGGEKGREKGWREGEKKKGMREKKMGEGEG